MKNFTLHQFLILHCFLLLFFVSELSAQNSKPILRVGFVENKPFSYLDENGEAKGGYLDIFNPLLEEDKFDVEFVTKEFNVLLDEIEAGKIDILLYLIKTEDREKYIIYTNENIYISWLEIIVNKNSNITSVYDLQNKKIGVLPNSLHVHGDGALLDIMHKYSLEVEIMEYNSNEEIIRALQNNEIDGFPTSRVNAYRFIKEYGFKQSGVVFYPNSIYVGVSKRNPNAVELVKILDRNIHEMKNNPSSIYFYSSNDYYSNHLDVRMQLPSWVKWTFYVMSFLVLCLIVILFIKYRKVYSEGVRSARNQLLNLLHEFGHSGKVTRNIDQLLFFLNKIYKNPKQDDYAINGYRNAMKEFKDQSSEEIMELANLSLKCRYTSVGKRIKHLLDILLDNSKNGENLLQSNGMINTFNELQQTLKYIEAINERSFLNDVGIILRDRLPDYREYYRKKGVADIIIEESDDTTKLAIIERQDMEFILDKLLFNSFNAISNNGNNNSTIIISVSSSKTNVFFRFTHSYVGNEMDDWDKMISQTLSGSGGIGKGLLRVSEILHKYRGSIEFSNPESEKGESILVILKTPEKLSFRIANEEKMIAI